MVELQVIAGLRRVETEVARGSPYEAVLAALHEAEQMEGAEEAAYGIADCRFMIGLVYDRPVAELEAALRDCLALDSDPVSRARTAGAAYATYPELVPYFDSAVAEVEALPRTPLIERALESAARVRARVAAMKRSLPGR